MGPKRGDLEPPLIVDVSDAAGKTDLTQAESWRMIARLRGTSAPVFIDNLPVATIDPVHNSRGSLRHNWVLGETATAGVIEIECKVTWPGGTTQKFPICTVTIGESIA